MAPPKTSASTDRQSRLRWRNDLPGSRRLRLTSVSLRPLTALAVSTPVLPVDAVVRRFLGDDDVVGVALLEPRGRHPDELRRRCGARRWRSNRPSPIPARRPPMSWVNWSATGPLVRDHSFDPLGNQLRDVLALLEVAVARALGLLHGADGAHPAIGLEGPALIEDLLSGRFLDAGEERTDHHRVGARRRAPC